jgi:hypothetical protein
MRLAVLSPIAAIVLVSASFNACDRPVTGPNGPSSISFSGAPSSLIGTTIQPQVLGVQRGSVFACPEFPPLTTRLQLSVTSPGTGDVSLGGISFQFIDIDGVESVPLEFFRDDLVALFGSTVIRGGTTRDFDFAPRFGCAIGQPRSLVMRPVFVDGLGSHPSTLMVPFN